MGAPGKKSIIRKRTPVELIEACFKNEGVRPEEGKSRTAWVNERYDVTVDARKGFYVATRKSSLRLARGEGA